ncbi:MAG: pyridoxal phosphate-dependent aminotransferase [Bacteroidetes bacterium]|nr:pyridoxal phosphate-dependent aminotransferase [Bacteroidota bacterium]
MKDTPIKKEIVDQKIIDNNIADVGKASIRVIKKLVDEIERESNSRFVRMEMGVPGLPPCQIGVEAEIEALKKGVAAIYPDIQGIPELKKEISRFVKLFLDIDVDTTGCIPTVGSMQGGFAAFLLINNMYEGKDTTLFLDPGFPVHKQQHRLLDIKYESFDVYNYRGSKLREKLESYLSKGNISCMLYSNPNNPSWICFTDEELKIIAEMADKYNIIIMEDLAYFAMDFRKDYSVPGKPPYQPTVAKYTNNWILFISSSKAFSYAGQRIGMMVISDHLFNTKSERLRKRFTSDIFGNAMIFGTVYSLSSGTAHSPQYALAAILKATNDGKYNFRNDVKEYGEKAHIMKKLFIDNGFKIVYDKDIDQPIADGFYFTYSYPGYTGEELLKEMLYYGISAISLAITGSEKTEGMRACVSLVNRNQFPDLEARLKCFHENNPY